MFKKIGFLALLMLCFTINVDAQKNSKDAQRKAKQKEMERQRKEAERAKKGKKSKEEKETKEVTSDDLDENKMQGRRGWPEWLVVGTSLNGGYSNGWNIGVTPWAGYKVTDRFWAGVGLDYIYSSFRRRGSSDKRTFSVLGPKVHTCYYITPVFSVNTEFALNRYTVTDVASNQKFKESGPSNTWLVGGGYTQRSDRFGIRIEVFYDALWESVEVAFRSTPIVYRVNLIYGF